MHPTIDGAGRWSLPWRWAAAGTYRVFADFVPTATGETLTLTSTVEVAGDLRPGRARPRTPRPPSTASRSPLDGTLRAGQDVRR